MAIASLALPPMALVDATGTHSCRLSRFGISWFTVIVFCLVPLGALRGDGKESSKDQVKRALTEQRFPWYDAEKDELAPLFPKKTESAKKEQPKTERLAPEREAFPLGRLVSVLLWLLLALVIGAAIVALIWLGQDLFDKAPAPQSAEPEPEIESARLEALPEKVRGKGDLLERAQELAKAGNYSEAIAFLHGWQLVQLDKHGKIELQKGKTNRQYLEELYQGEHCQGELSAALSGSAREGSASAELRNTFHRSTRLFEDAFYGHLPITEDAFQSVWSKVALFEKAHRRIDNATGEMSLNRKTPRTGEKAAKVARSEKPSPRKGPPS